MPVIIGFVAGLYPAFYMTRFRPAEVLWHKGKAILIRERENFDDLLKNQVDVKDLFTPKKENASVK